MGDAGLPDYVLDEDAVLKDTDVNWRHGRAPDYSKTRKVWAESKQHQHPYPPPPHWPLPNTTILTPPLQQSAPPTKSARCPT